MLTTNEYLTNLYDADIPILFEAVYNKDTTIVENTLLHLLEKILQRHPYKPRQDDQQTQREWKTLEMLLIFFDGVYFTWLKASHLPYTPDDKPEISEMNETLLNAVSTQGLKVINTFIYSTMHFLETDRTFYYDQQQLLQAIEEYKKTGTVSLFQSSPPHHAKANHANAAR
jgi:hypothetical protein